MSRLSLFSGRPDRTRTSPDGSARAGLRQVRWDGGVLSLLGDGRVDGQPGERPGETRVELELALPDGRRKVRLRTFPRYLPEATDDSGQDRHGLDWTGFTALLDPAQLQHRGHWQAGTWRVTALVSAGAARPVRTTLAAHWCGSAEYPPAHWVDRDVLVVPRFSQDTLHLTVLPGLAVATALTCTGTGFRVAGTAPAGAAGGTLVLRHRESDTAVACDTDWNGPAFTAAVPADRCGLPGHWEPALLGADGRTVDLRLNCPPGGRRQFPLPDRRALYAKQLSDQRLQFCVQDPEPLVDTVSAVPGGFALAGELPHFADRPVELVLRHGDGRERRRPAEAGPDGRFRTVLDLCPPASDGRPRPLAKGVWEAALRPLGDPGHPGLPLRLHPAVLPLLPAAGHAGPKAYLLERRWHDTLILDSTPTLSAVERSAHRQLRLRTEAYPAARRKPLRDAVLYDVFGGRSYSCNPRAVHEELVRRGLPLEHLWVVEDGQEEPPPGATAVRQWSPEWYEALATSRYLVGNTHFPDFLRRREGQVVAQLWHGTPLKRIARQVETDWLAEDGYLDRLAREVRQWNLLLSPSPFATPVLADSFDYRGEVLEAGYPRNDRLVRADPAEAAAVRAALRIPDGKRVVLYAPTWRDDQREGDRYRLDLRLDVEQARAALGEDHVLLLRPHVHVGGRTPDDDFVRDVADHPDVADLMLIADVLVTDYSSLMFDFAVTGRPMLFFTYDLEHYRTKLRGFTFDFEAHAPGPLLADPAAVVAALRDLDPEPYRERYRAFRERFCPLDDGRAAQRVADRLLALARGHSADSG